MSTLRSLINEDPRLPFFHIFSTLHAHFPPCSFVKSQTNFLPPRFLCTFFYAACLWHLDILELRLCYIHDIHIWCKLLYLFILIFYTLYFSVLWSVVFTEFEHQKSIYYMLWEYILGNVFKKVLKFYISR